MNLILLASLIGTGLLLVALGVPMWKRMIPQNQLYGFRTPLTLSNKKVWYEANAIGGKDLTIGGLFLILAGLPMPLLPETAAAIAAAVAMCAILAVTIGHTFYKTSAYLADSKHATSQTAPKATPIASLPQEVLQTLADDRPLEERTKRQKTTE